MIEINGAYANAIVFTDEIEASAAGQILALCDQPFAAGAKIRIMPVQIQRPVHEQKEEISYGQEEQHK